MIDDDFCIFLEYHLGAAFENSGKEEVSGFWSKRDWFNIDLKNKKIEIQLV
jgi:hypothetical protein